ncbi:hypothetical protein ACWDKQ_29205 [Saccharopolyspora sp. NPDC000995]
MNPGPDYSASYVVIRTDATDGPQGHVFAFTIGRGNDVQTAAIRALESALVGHAVEEILDDLGGMWRELVLHAPGLRHQRPGHRAHDPTVHTGPAQVLGPGPPPARHWRWTLG